MAALSQLVPLVPVVGNAETMTEEHAQKLQEQFKVLAEKGIPAPTKDCLPLEIKFHK
jgi:septin family protein